MSEFIDGLRTGLQDAGENVLNYVPKLIGALLILIVGWIIARFLHRVFIRLLKAVGLDQLLERAGLAERLQAAGYTATDLAARAVYWIVLLVVFLQAAQTLEADYLSDILSDMISYLPLVVVAIVIVIVAAALGAFLADLSTPWSEGRHIRWLPETARWLVIGFGALAALNTLNIAEEIANILLIAVVGTVGLTLVIAFGVGGIPAAKEWWSRTLPGRD